MRSRGRFAFSANAKTWVFASVMAAGSLVGSPRPAAADVSAADKTAADALFDQAKALMAEQKYEEASRKFEASQKLDPGIGTLLFLADCYEKAGHTASAWTTFREAASMAKAAGQAEREEIARARVKLLEAKLAKLRVVLDAVASLPGLEIRRDDASIPQELCSEPFPVDPGKHTLSIRASGKKTWSTSVEIPSDPAVQTVVVPMLEDAPPEKDPVVSPPPGKTEPVVASSGLGGQRIAGIALMGLGIAGLGVSGVFTGIALSKDKQADEHCDSFSCRDQAGADLSKQATDAASISTLGFGVGAAALVTGVIVYLVAPKAKQKELSTALQIVPTSRGVVVMGKW